MRHLGIVCEGAYGLRALAEAHAAVQAQKPDVARHQALLHQVQSARERAENYRLCWRRARPGRLVLPTCVRSVYSQNTITMQRHILLNISQYKCQMYRVVIAESCLWLLWLCTCSSKPVVISQCRQGLMNLVQQPRSKMGMPLEPDAL